MLARKWTNISFNRDNWLSVCHKGIACRWLADTSRSRPSTWPWRHCPVERKTRSIFLSSDVWFRHLVSWRDDTANVMRSTVKSQRHEKQQSLSSSSLKERKKERKKERMNEWMNEWMNKQSARRWLVTNPAVGYHYFPLGPRLPSQPKSVTALCQYHTELFSLVTE